MSLALVAFGAMRVPFAQAAEPLAVGFDDKDRAREAMKEGIEAFRAGNYEAARSALEKSFRTRPSHDAAGVLGQTYLALGDHRQASNYLAYCVDHYPTAGKRETLKKVEDDLRESSKHVLGLRIFANVDGSTVHVDGVLAGNTPADRVFVEPGEHTVVVAHPDGRSETRQVKGQAGQEVTVTVAFRAPASGTAPLDSGLDDPSSPADASPQPLRSEGSTRAVPSMKWPVVIGTGALGLAGFGVGVGFLVDSNGKADEARALGSDACVSDGARCDEYLGLAGASEDSQTISTLGFVAGGAFVAAATLTYFLWTDEDEGGAVRASVSVDPRSGAPLLTFGGKF